MSSRLNKRAVGYSGVCLSMNHRNEARYVAQRNIKEGEVILWEDAVITAPIVIDVTRTTLEENKEKSCLFEKKFYASLCANAFCGKVAEASEELTCVKCTYFYCSEQCMKAYQVVHEKECNVVLHNTADRVEWMNILNRVLAMDLQIPHVIKKAETMNTDAMRTTIFLNYLKRLQEVWCSEDKPDFSEKMWRWWSMCLPMKSFIGGYQFGMGLYLLAYYIGRSCTPNCYYYFQESRIVVRAGRNVSKGEEISFMVEIGMLFMPTDVRHKHLGFMCECERCVADNREVQDKALMQLNRSGMRPDRQNVLRSHSISFVKEKDLNNAIEMEKTIMCDLSEQHCFRYTIYCQSLHRFWEEAKSAMVLHFPSKLMTALNSWKEKHVARMLSLHYCYCHFMKLLLENDAYEKGLLLKKRVDKQLIGASSFQRNSIKDRLQRKLAMKQPAKPASIDSWNGKVKFVIEKYLDWSVFDFDLLLYASIPPLKLTIENCKASTATEFNISQFF